MDDFKFKKNKYGKKKKKHKKQYQNKRQRLFQILRRRYRRERRSTEAILRLRSSQVQSAKHREHRRMRNLEKYGNNNLKEYIAIQIDLCLKKFCLQRGTEIDLQRIFEEPWRRRVPFRRDAALSAFQVKSTLCRDKWEVRFSKTNIYQKSVLVCVVLNRSRSL